MHFHVITLFPEMVQAALKFGVVGQAVDARKIQVSTYDPRTWTTDVHRAVDDRPFGGGDGMVMLPETLQPALDEVTKASGTTAKKIYLSARGKPFSDGMARELSQAPEVILLCGRYGGFDQRFIEQNGFIEVSIGDYVLSGGELGALVMIDAVGRLLPGVLGNAQSPQLESFANDGLLEAPQFTRPREWAGLAVPEVLFSGNHAKIQEWREVWTVLASAQNRPDLLEKKRPSEKLLQKALKHLNDSTDSELRSCGLRNSNAIRTTLETLLKSKTP